MEFYYLWKKKLSLSTRTPARLTVTLPDTNVRNVCLNLSVQSDEWFELQTIVLEETKIFQTHFETEMQVSVFTSIYFDESLMLIRLIKEHFSILTTSI